MIVSWISRDNRKAYRAKRSRAQRQGIELAIHRVSSTAVGDHIVTLTCYLASPSTDNLDALVAQEAAHQHVVRYIGSQTQIDDPISDADTAHARHAADRERVLQVLTRNLISHDLADIQFEMATIAGLSPAGEDPIEHIVLSWPSDECPSSEQVEAALDMLLAVAGMSRHQAYAVLHGDTGNIHLHVALNRIDPATGERRQIGLDLERSIETLHQAVAIIEHRQGWAPQQGGLYRADDAGCYERASGIKVRDAAMYPCASDADRKRIRALRAQEKVERKITSEAANYERRTGLQSIQRRVIEAAAPVLREAHGWDAVHLGLAAEGMRYTMLTSGAVIECGDRTIAASTAWGGGSAAKMIERLGAYAEPPADLAVAPFEERVIPTLHNAAEQRRARERLRADRQALVESADGAHRIFSERYHAQVAADPRSDGEALNDARRDASAAVSSAREALALLLASERKRLKRRRALSPGSQLDDLAFEEQEKGEDGKEWPSRGIFIAADGGAAPLVDPHTIDEPFEVACFADRNEHRRNDRLAFVERAERIDLVAADDASLRAALRIAHRKWGKVAVVGDRTFLDRLAQLAVEEGIELTNPELQGRLVQLRQNAELERRHAAIELARNKEAGPSQIAPAVPAVLADYDPQFMHWIELQADLSVPRAKVNAAAVAILLDPRLKMQLAELESQQFEFAIQLRRAGRRHVRNMIAASEQWDADDDRLSEGPSSVSDLASSVRLEAAIEQGMVSLTTLPIAAGSSLASEASPSAIAKVSSQIAAAPDRSIPARVQGSRAEARPTAYPVPDIDRRYLDWADRHRGKMVAGLEREFEAALRARVGDLADPPRHIAMLLLREARRNPCGRSSFGKPTDLRDAGEIAALSRDANFARLLAAARAGDRDLMHQLERSASGAGDALGRVPLVQGRLMFAHASPHGHDRGAFPPLEWIHRDLAKLDFTRVRLSRHKGLIGVFDPDLLAAVHYNYVGLLYPQIQTQLEVEWRLQRERDLAALHGIQTGGIVIDTTIELEHGAYAAIRVRRGKTSDERVHIEGMARDAAVLLDCRAAQRGTLKVDQPRAASFLIAAYLRALDQQADAAVRMLMLRRLQAERLPLAGIAAIDCRILEQAIVPAPPVLAGQRGRKIANRGQQRAHTTTESSR